MLLEEARIREEKVNSQLVATDENDTPAEAQQVVYYSPRWVVTLGLSIAWKRRLLARTVCMIA